MKQIATILLMSLLMFNIAGYRLTLRWMQHAQNISFEEQLDAAAYDESSLIEIAVPLSLPYYNNWGEWERYDGEIQVGGQTWKYVKRKIENGKLVVKCLPNPQQQIIQKNVSSAFAQINGLSTSDPASKSVKKVIKASQFEYEELAIVDLSKVFIVLIEKPGFLQSVPLLHATSLSPWQPPEMIS